MFGITWMKRKWSFQWFCRSIYEEFHPPNTIFDIFKVMKRSYTHVIQKNAFLMIPSSLYIKVYFWSYDQSITSFLILFIFQQLKSQISQIDQNGYNPFLRWNRFIWRKNNCLWNAVVDLGGSATGIPPPTKNTNFLLRPLFENPWSAPGIIQESGFGFPCDTLHLFCLLN